MPESCTSEPNQKCRLSTTVALLEKRVADLEDGQEKEADFRAAYYDDQRRRIDHDARMDAKIAEIDAKLDTLLEWQKAQQDKPVKRWDGIVDKSVWAILAAVIAFLLARIGL